MVRGFTWVDQAAKATRSPHRSTNILPHPANTTMTTTHHEQHTELAHSSSLTLDTGSHTWVPARLPQYTGAQFSGRLWMARWQLTQSHNADTHERNHTLLFVHERSLFTDSASLVGHIAISGPKNLTVSPYFPFSLSFCLLLSLSLRTLISAEGAVRNESSSFCVVK